MRRRSLLAASLALPLTSPAYAASEPIPVVASFTILADFVRQIGGDQVFVAELVGPGGDVHTFQPRPSDSTRLHAATIVVENGLNLEGWLGRLVTAAGFNGRRIVASGGIPTRTFAEDGRTVTDPHIWQDPQRAARMVATIADGLAVLSGKADVIRARAAAYITAITQEDAAIQQAVAAIPPAKRQIITSHDAFGYYGARYGITFRAAQGISTEAEPTPRDLARLAAQIRHDHVRAIFVETMTDPRVAAALAREAGAVVGGQVYSDSLSPPNGPAPPTSKCSVTTRGCLPRRWRVSRQGSAYRDKTTPSSPTWPPNAVTTRPATATR